MHRIDIFPFHDMEYTACANQALIQRPKLQLYTYGSLLMEIYGLLIVHARLELSTLCIVQSQFESAGNPFHNLTDSKSVVNL